MGGTKIIIEEDFKWILNPWIKLIWFNKSRTRRGFTGAKRSHYVLTENIVINTLRPRWNEQHFADDIFKRIFFNENVWISIKISLGFVPKGPINNIPALVQIIAWHCSDNKPLSEPMMVSLLTHKCVTQPQWVNSPPWWCHDMRMLSVSMALLWGKPTGPRLNIKTVLSMYGDFHVKDKTAVRTSYL